MATVSRYTNKDPILNGTETTKLSLEDKLPLQHTTGDNADKYASILAATATPYGTTSTAAGTATKTVTLSNFPAAFTALVGTKVRVKFTYANTATTQMYLKIGSLAAKPATCRGFAMGAGSVLAGSEIEFMYNGSAWDCQFCEAISTADTTSKSPINSTALNGALENYQPIKAQTLGANVSLDTGIYANKGTPTSGNSKVTQLLRQKAFLVMLNMVYSTEDKTSYILGVMRVGRDTGNVTFTEITTGGYDNGVNLLRNITFTAGTGDDDTVIITNPNTANVMVDILL